MDAHHTPRSKRTRWAVRVQALGEEATNGEAEAGIALEPIQLLHHRVCHHDEHLWKGGMVQEALKAIRFQTEVLGMNVTHAQVGVTGRGSALHST